MTRLLASRACAAALFFAAFVMSHAVHAQDVRDPTRPPPGASVPVLEAAKVDGSSAPLDGTAVVVRDGKLYLASGTRLYAVGQQIGPHKIERITETEVWLRNGTQVQKIQRFEGVQRRAVQP